MSKYTVDKDSKLTLDARKGTRTKVNVDRPGAVSRVLVVDSLLGFNDRGVDTGVLVFGDSEAYVVPTKAAEGVGLEYGLSAVIGSPANETKPYQYYVAVPAPPGAVPANPVFDVRTKDLAVRNARFRGQGKPGLAEFGRAPSYLPSQFFLFGAYTTVALPTVRTEYLSPEWDWITAMSFQRPIEQPNPTFPFGHIWQVTSKPAAGKPLPDEWNAASIGPSLDLAPNFSTQVVRSGDRLFALIGMFTPAGTAQGNHVPFQTITSTGDTTLQLAGQEPVGSGLPGAGGYAGLPEESAAYTLRSTATRTDRVPWSTLSTQVEASWKFRSSAADDLLPLMYLRTTGAFDGINQARPGLFGLGIDVLRQPRSTPTTAKVKKVTLDFSTDDGKTWTPAIVVGRGEKWHALLLNPHSGFVSLRTTAADSAGDTHSTTVIRAYGIK